MSGITQKLVNEYLQTGSIYGAYHAAWARFVRMPAYHRHAGSYRRAYDYVHKMLRSALGVAEPGDTGRMTDG